MDPIFIQIGPLAVRWYGLLIASGVLVGAFWALRLCEKRGLDPEKLLDMALWLVIAGVVGARLVYVLTSPSAFFGPNGSIIDAFKVWQGGISIHGGVIGIMVAMWFYCRRHGLDMWAYLDTLTPVGALGIIGGRIGNIMNGSDTGGRLTNMGIGFTWPEPGSEFLGAFGRFVFGDQLWQFAPPACLAVPAGEPCVVHFTQAYGILVGVILLVIIAVALRRQSHATQAALAAASHKPAPATSAKPAAASVKRRGPQHLIPNPGYVFWLFVLWYSILRSVLEEPFRDNPLAWNVYLNEATGVGMFTYTQLASIPIILVAIYMMLTAGSNSAAPAPAAKVARG